MLRTRSAVFKMITSEAHEDRKISVYPPPYSSYITPYTERDFNEEVRKVCSLRSLSPHMSKVIILGDVTVGKTSLVNRFCHTLFNNNYKATIGVDFEVERFDILGVPFNLQIWDTAGQERFKCIAASYYRNANVIIVVFDLTNYLSLTHCQQWLLDASQCSSQNVKIFLVGTKRDLMTNKMYEILERRVVLVARSMKAEYWAVSAKTGDGVVEFFSRVAALAFNNAVLEDIQNYRSEPLVIGSDLIRIKRSAEIANCNDKEFVKCANCFVNYNIK